MNFKFAISTLMAIVLLISGGLSAVRFASDGLASLILAFALLLFAYAYHLSMAREGKRRAFWAGFAIGGSIYLALTLGPQSNTPGNHTIKGGFPTIGFENFYNIIYIMNDEKLGEMTLEKEYCICDSCKANYLAWHKNRFVRLVHSLLSMTVATAAGTLSFYVSKIKKIRQNLPAVG